MFVIDKKDTILHYKFTETLENQETLVNHVTLQYCYKEDVRKIKEQHDEICLDLIA